MANDKVIKLSGWPKGIISKRENPFDFPPDALVYGENVDLVDGCIKTRLGTSIMSAGSLPSGRVMALYQVRFPTNETSFIIAQVDTVTARNIYACSTALPTTTGVFTKIYDLGATAGTISIAVLNDRVIITEGVAAGPLVWGGATTASPTVTDWMYPKQVLVSIDGVTFYDITATVCDQDSAVSAGIGSITKAGYIAICTDMPKVEGFYVQMDQVNTGLSQDLAATLNFSTSSDWATQDLRVGTAATIANWNQNSGVTGRFETSGAVAVSLGVGNTCPGIVAGAQVNFSDATVYVVSVTGDGTAAGAVTLSAAHVDGAVDSIKGLVQSGGSVAISNANVAWSTAITRTLASDSGDYSLYSVRAIIRNATSSYLGTAWTSLTANISGYSYRVVIPAASISTSGSRVRVKLDSDYSGASLSISGISIAERSGSTENAVGTFGSATFKQMYINGAAGTTIANGYYTWTDWLDFAIDETKDYLIIMDFNASSWLANKTGTGYYKAATASYNTASPAGFSSWAGIAVVKEMEVGPARATSKSIKVTVTSGNGALTCDHVSIVERNGETANGIAIPTELKFSGVSGCSIGGAYGTATSDALTFNYDDNKQYLVIFDVVSGKLGYTAAQSHGIYKKSGTPTWDQQTVTGFTDGSAYNQQWAVSKVEVLPDTPSIAFYSGTSTGSMDCTTWSEMVSGSTGQTTPGSSVVRWAITNDAGATYRVYKSSAWLPIVQLSGGTTWQYWNGSAWADASINNAYYALNQAMAVVGNQWVTADIAAMVKADWEASGGIDIGTTTAIGWAFGMQVSGTDCPLVQSVTLTHREPDNAVTEEFHSAGAWGAGGGFTNNTKTGAISFAQSGTIMYNTAGGYTADYFTLNEIPGYWFRINTNGTSASTSITRVLYKAPCQLLSSIGSGQPDIPSGFIFHQVGSGSIQDYTVNVGDNVKTSLSKADIPMTASDYLYLGYYTKFGAVDIEPYIDNNTNTATLSAQYWNGLAFTALTITDGTATSGKCFAAKGKISFTAPTDWKMCIPPLPGSPRFPRAYWIRFSVNTTLTTTTAISEVRVYPTPEALVKHSFAVALNDRLALLGRPDAKDQVDISASFFEYVWTGADSVSYRIGGTDAIQCAMVAWNGLFIGKTETWHQLKGGSPSDFQFEAVEAARHVPINTQCIVKAPIGGFDYGDRYALLYLNRYGAFISTGLHTDSLWNSSRGKTISEPLLWWDTNAAPRLDLDNLHICCGTYWPLKNWAIWSVPMITTGSTPQTTNNRLIVYDLTLQAWLPPFTIAAASLCTGYHYSATGPQKLGDLGLYAGDYTGNIYRLFDKAITTDNGTAITGYIETGWLHFDAPELEKLIRNIYLYGSTTGTSITLEVYRDGKTTADVADTFTITDLTNPTGKLFTQAFNHRNIYSNYFKFKISFTGPTSIYAMQLNLESLRDWPTT